MNLRSLRLVLLIAVVIGGVYLSFELGRYQSGFSMLDNRRQSEELQGLLRDRDERIDALERQIAILETSSEIDQQTYASVEDNLSELQARIQEQEEELVFYRGIVTPGDGVAGLRIQNVEIEPGASESTHMLRVLLVQAIVHNDRVTGSVRATLRGRLAGEDVELGLDELGSEGGATDIPYGFRYFQTLELGLSLPVGLEPAELEVQVWPRDPRGDPIVQSFPWPRISG